MPLIKNDRVERMLELTEIYNTAAGAQMETVILDLSELMELMTLEERYSANVHMVAKRGNVTPEFTDGQLTWLYGEKLEDKMNGLLQQLDITHPENPSPKAN